MSDTDYLYGLLQESHLDLMYLPSGAVAWLYDRPENQVTAAARIGVEAKRYGDPITKATLLRADQNVLVLRTASDITVKVYPDGGYGMDNRPLFIDEFINMLQDYPPEQQYVDAEPDQAEVDSLEYNDLLFDQIGEQIEECECEDKEDEEEVEEGVEKIPGIRDNERKFDIMRAQYALAGKKKGKDKEGKEENKKQKKFH